MTNTGEYLVCNSYTHDKSPSAHILTEVELVWYNKQTGNHSATSAVAVWPVLCCISDPRVKVYFPIQSRLPTYSYTAVKTNKQTPNQQTKQPNPNTKPKIFALFYFIELKIKPWRPVERIVALHHSRISPGPGVVVLTVAANIYSKLWAQF